MQIKISYSNSPPSVFPNIVYDKSKRADSPGYRIAVNDRRDRGRDLHHYSKPDDAEQADARQRNDHRYDYIPDAPQRPCEHLDDDIDDVPRDDEDEHIAADPDHICVCGKHAEKDLSCRDQEQNENARYRQVDQKADPCAPAHSVHLARAVVLPHKRSDRDAESGADHPENSVQLAVGGPGGGGVGAKGVDRGHDRDIGDGEQDGFQSCRDPHLKLCLQHSPVKTNTAEGKMKDILRPHQIPRDKDGAHCLCDQRGDRRAHDSHMENDDEQAVQHDIDDAADDQIVQRPLRISRGSEDRGTHIVDQHEQDPCEINPQIDDRILHGVGRRAHEFEQSRRAQDADDCENRAARCGDRICVVQPLVCRFFISCAEELRDRDRGAGGKAGEEADDQGDDLRGGSAHTGEGLLPHELSDDHAVYRVVELLKKCAQQDREKEEQKLLPDDPFGNCIFCLRW